MVRCGGQRGRLEHLRNLAVHGEGRLEVLLLMEGRDDECGYCVTAAVKA